MADIRIVFPHVEGHWTPQEQAIQRELAQIMIASARLKMPHAQIAMMTDLNTPALDGVDVVLRKKMSRHWIPWLCGFLAELSAGEILYVDTDIVIQRDLSALFAPESDIILTTRGPKTIEDRQMPFLFGCIAYRTPAFWDEVRERVMKMTDERDLGWWGSQVAVFDMWMEEQNGRGRWKIQVVNCDPHNYTPKTPYDKGEGKWVLHYKGKKRKAWMVSNWRHLLQEKAVA